MPQHPIPVAKARAGTIETPVLETVRAAAWDVAHGQTISHAAAELMMLCLPSLLDELIVWRSAGVAPIAGGNVIAFRGA